MNPEFYDLAPDLEWDSRVGIGSIDSSGNPYDENGLNHIGIDWTNFENGGDVSADNGVWFLIPTDPAGESTGFTSQDCSVRNGVWIARLTTMDLSSEIMFDALFQGRDGASEVWQDSTGGTITYQGELDCNMNQVPDACDIANGTSDDANGNGIPDACELAEGDLNLDGCIDGADLAIMLGLWGITNPPIGDLDGDGDVDGADLAFLLGGWRPCGG